MDESHTYCLFSCKAKTILRELRTLILRKGLKAVIYVNVGMKRLGFLREKVFRNTELTKNSNRVYFTYHQYKAEVVKQTNNDC